MPKIRFSGPLPMSLSSFIALNTIALKTYVRHLFGRRIAPDWGVNMEIGILFWRRQFIRAMQMQDMARGRLLFDSVQTEGPDHYDVTRQMDGAGCWHLPAKTTGDGVVLYLHGGGYSFHGAMSRRFADMLAHHLGLSVYAADYRLTPEHPHPAQIDDALAAWGKITQDTPPDRVIVIGDSAGGHLMFSLLHRLKETGAAQPALGVGLCPWTDIGDRGASLHENDRYDLVQGWMALQFGEWLDPDGVYGRSALSPIEWDFEGCAPLYLQIGGRDILRDMCVEFAEKQAARGHPVMLDLWPDMPHDFQLYDSFQPSAVAALARLKQAVTMSLSNTPTLPPAGPQTRAATASPLCTKR
jgi:acetyl esterase/lipase